MSVKKKMPRGVRNNNPTNLRKTSDPWQGLAKEQTDSAFFVFKDPVYGLRAGARTFLTYQDRHDLNTVEELIGRWAPRNENDTDAYIDAVADHMGVDRDEPIDTHQYEYMLPLLEAVVQHENGIQPYTPAQFDRALALAGIEPSQKPLSKSRTVNAGTASVTVGGVTTAAGAVAAAGPAVGVLGDISQLVQDHWQVLLIGGGLATLLLAGYMIYARYDDARKLRR